MQIDADLAVLQLPGQGLPEHLCNNTESALANELMTHALTLSLVNESWVPPLLATLGGNCHWAVGCAADALFAGHPVFRIRRPLPDLKSGLNSLRIPIPVAQGFTRRRGCMAPRTSPSRASTRCCGAGGTRSSSAHCGRRRRRATATSRRWGSRACSRRRSATVRSHLELRFFTPFSQRVVSPCSHLVPHAQPL